MQTVAVFVAVLAVASAHVVSVPHTQVQSQRLGGSFAYSTSEGQSLGVVSPAATTYSLSGLPVSSVNGIQYSSLPATVSGVQYSSLPATVSGVQYSAVPAYGSNVQYAGLSGVQYSSYPVSSLSGVPVVANTNNLVQAGTPAATYKTVSGVSAISGWPVASYVI